MNVPIVIHEQSFQKAWAKAIMTLKDMKWSGWNLIVQVDNCSMIQEKNHNVMEKYAKQHGLIGQNQVSYTIFPYKLYKEGVGRERFYKYYWRYFEKTRHMEHSGWGTYFERMIRYVSGNKTIDQLGSIIDNINNRDKTFQAAYTMLIPYPHRDSNKMMGAPCLNYVTVQVENNNVYDKQINLLAVYRNHDFTERAYGNYYGLCNLLNYIANETNAIAGNLTCISSHAYVPNYKKELASIAEGILNNEYV